MTRFIPIDMPRCTHYGSNYYETYSLKVKRNIRLFSELEYKNFLTLEMNPDVVEFCEQPIKIEIEIDGIIEHSIFDMWVKYIKGTEEMQEVKYTKDLDQNNDLTRRVKRQILKQEQWCKINGFKYSIRTENSIEVSTYYISNLRYLYGLVKRSNLTLCRRNLKMLKNIIAFETISIKDIQKLNLLQNEYLYTTIAIGIYDGEIHANLHKIINYETEISFMVHN